MKQNYENNHQVKKILMAINVEARKTLSVWQQYKALYKESGKYNQHESDDISGTWIKSPQRNNEIINRCE